MEEFGKTTRKALEYCKESLMSHSPGSLEDKIAERNRQWIPGLGGFIEEQRKSECARAIHVIFLAKNLTVNV